ncbi:MAG: hypothetical protein R3Y23_02505 [Bacillota bacterium]
MEKICSCFGHRDVELTPELEKAIADTVASLFQQGASIFYFGGFGDFDKYCHTAVTRMKEKHPNIKRVYCLEDERYLRESKRPKYLKAEDYEEFIYIPLKYDYWYTRIYYRNLEIMDSSDFIIFYIRNEEKSGAYKCYKYARQNKFNIIKV